MTMTLDQFTAKLNAVFAELDPEYLNRLLKNWGGDKDLVRTRLINKFNAWPDVLKDKVKIDVALNPELKGRHRFLSFKGAPLTTPFYVVLSA